MKRSLTVLEGGPFTTVQDGGRLGMGALGIGRSGACDRASYQLANRLVGNRPGSAVLETTFGGLSIRAEQGVTVATTGARCSGSTPHNAPVWLPSGAELRLGTPMTGLRTYLAVSGGIDVDPVLDSRSTDVLAGLGPPAVQAGDVLPVGDARGAMPGLDVAPVKDPEGAELVVRIGPGPRREWFTEDAWATLVGQVYGVSSDCDRVGVRLDGTPLQRRQTGELPSEGMTRGALQIPPSGTPVLFLADHPVTGGYPVIAYVVDEDVDLCAQLRPGQTLRFRGTPDG